MNCPSCGKPTRAGAGFCGECGFRLSAVASEPALVEAPVVEQPLRRPPPPPPPPADVPQAPLAPEVQVVAPVAVVTPVAVPEVAPLLVPPPPPSIPKVIEVIPFGTTKEVVAAESEPDAPKTTITLPPPGIADPPPTTAPAAATVVAPAPESIDETRVSVRRRSGARWRLVLPDARHVEVSTTLLVGRDPSANAKWTGAELLKIDDEANSVSKTHAVFEVNAEGLWVTDLDSTNGVVITQPDGTELDLEPNVRGLIQPGADVELGDYIVQVEKD